MVATTVRARPKPGHRERETPSIASGFFQTLNRFVEPVAESGCFSPEFWPTGLILLETTGRRSGRPHQTPVLAMMMDGYLIVRTFRGERSDWFKNVRANPDVSYWAGGSRKRARATVHTPGEECETKALPPFAALGVAATSVAVGLMGWRFAVLAPMTNTY
jgi:deazaflavin-dependent oxidoreductase (nitroreductase family)